MTTEITKSIFIDTNILIYANALTSPFHQVAVDTIETLVKNGTELWISRQVLREFLMALTRPQTFVNPQPIEVLVARVQWFERQFQIAEDNAQVTSNLLNLLQQVPTGGRQVYDANIVATMLTNGIQYLLTHNVSDFQRFSTFIDVIPLVDSTP